MPETKLPQKAALLDVDRTILRTEAFSRRVYAALGEMGIKQAIVDQLQHEQTKADHCYDYLARAYELIGGSPINIGTVWQLADYITRAGSGSGGLTEEFRRDIVVDGVPELIAELQDAGIVPILCTAGGEMTQRLKLIVLQRTLGTDLQWIIVRPDQQRKASMVAEIYNHSSGLFEFDNYARQARASSYILGNKLLKGIKGVYVIDDKWINVSDIPEGTPVVGILTQVAEYEDDGAERVAITEVMKVIGDNTIDK